MRLFLKLMMGIALVSILYLTPANPAWAQQYVCDRDDNPTACWAYETVEAEPVVYYTTIRYEVPYVFLWHPNWVFYLPIGCPGWSWPCARYAHRVYVWDGVYVDRTAVVFYDPGYIIVSRPFGWTRWYDYRVRYNLYVPYHARWDHQHRRMHVHAYDSDHHRRSGQVAPAERAFYKEPPRINSVKDKDGRWMRGSERAVAPSQQGRGQGQQAGPTRGNDNRVGPPQSQQRQGAVQPGQPNKQGQPTVRRQDGQGTQGQGAGPGQQSNRPQIDRGVNQRPPQGQQRQGNVQGGNKPSQQNVKPQQPQQQQKVRQVKPKNQEKNKKCDQGQRCG